MAIPRLRYGVTGAPLTEILVQEKESEDLEGAGQFQCVRTNLIV